MDLDANTISPYQQLSNMVMFIFIKKPNDTQTLNFENIWKSNRTEQLSLNNSN